MSTSIATTKQNTGQSLQDSSLNSYKLGFKGQRSQIITEYSQLYIQIVFGHLLPNQLSSLKIECCTNSLQDLLSLKLQTGLQKQISQIITDNTVGWNRK